MENQAIIKHEEGHDNNSLLSQVAIVEEQITAIAQLMKKTMKKDEHYGEIPGITKPSLLKSGAEKLCTLFSLAPEYKIDIKYSTDGLHREYIVTCKLVNRKSGDFWGEGVGSASTMESKWRYRNDYERTGKVVPKEYWDNAKDPKYIGGNGFIAKKEEDGRWVIYKSNGKIENPDIADTYNTVLKIAKKRAHVDAVLTATSASDIFTQDVEDITDLNKNVSAPGEKNITPKSQNNQPPTKKTPEQKYSELPEEVRDLFDSVATSKEMNPRYAICESKKWEPKLIIEWLHGREKKAKSEKENPGNSEYKKLTPGILNKMDLVKDMIKNRDDFCTEYFWNTDAINKKLDELLVEKNKKISAENNKSKKEKNIVDADFQESIDSLPEDDINADPQANQDIP